jgi:hypothetical protein
MKDDTCQWPGCNNPALCASGNFGGKLVCEHHFQITNGGEPLSLLDNPAYWLGRIAGIASTLPPEQPDEPPKTELERHREAKQAAAAFRMVQGTLQAMNRHLRERMRQAHIRAAK